MKNKPLLFAVIYAAVYITGTLVLYFSQRFALFNMVYIMGMALLIPFIILTIKIQRDTVYNGIISGREAAKEGMRFVLYSALLLVLFQSVFYYAGWRDFKTESIPGFIREQALQLDKMGKRPFDEKQLQIAITEEIKNITLFKEITFVFLRCMVVGIFTSFAAGLFMKSGEKISPQSGLRKS
jgi:hypothetical protein